MRLKTKLEAIGLRPINNVVDITNYVLHELGHPLHAFDAAKVSGALDIRMASAGEKFKALDEEEYSLTTEDVVISDATGKVLALGGVMGGFDSGVTETTTDIILESAYFTPSNIRRTSRRLILSSDSSYRFERGTDPQLVISSSAFAAKLIAELAGGTIDTTTAIAGEVPILTDSVELDVAKLDQLMGGSISLPSRFAGTFVQESDVDISYDYQMSLRKTLAAIGFYETQTIKLIAESSTDATVAQMDTALPVRPLQEGDVIRVALPLSEDHAIMRPSLTPGLVATAARNIRQGAKSLRFFEIGRQFRNAGGGKAKDLEADSLAFLMGGNASPLGWSSESKNLDAFDVKAVIEALLPNKVLQFSPRERENFILAADVLCEGVVQVDELPQFPGSSRDAAMEAPVTMPNSEIEKAVKKHNEMLLVSSACFDLFTDSSGEKLAADKKSIAYTFHYRSPERTMKAKEVDQAHQKLLDYLAKNLPITFR